MTVALIAAGALLASCVQATAGIGFALILMPVLLAAMQPVAAVLIATALGLLLCVLVLFAEPRRPEVAWREVAPILAAVPPGAVCGVLVLQALPKATLQIILGAVVLAAALAGERRPSPRAPRSRRGGPLSRLTLGFATGTLSTSTGVNGPPLALWLRARGLAPHAVRDSLSMAFLGTNTVATLTLVPVLARARLDLGELAAAAVAVICGHAIGSRTFARLSGPRFHRILTAVILATGAASVAAGISAI